jgi:transcriptional regulator with XRE-family HTH domain
VTKSSAALRRLGAELRRLREAAGRTQTDVGQAIGRTHTTLVNWEGGKTKISKSDLAYLLAELRAPAEVRRGLEQLRDEAGRGGGQWAVYGLPGWLRPLVSFEEDAVKVSTFQPLVIPGLLQTEAYARATHLAAPHLVSPEDVDRWAAARMKRQQRLTGDKPLQLHAVIAEAALWTQVGSTAEMVEQLEKLLASADQRNVTVQVLPATSGAQAGVAGNFTILEFEQRTVDPPLAYFDGPLGGYLVDDEGDVAALEAWFRDLATAAVSETEAVELIRGRLDQLTRGGTGNG